MTHPLHRHYRRSTAIGDARYAGWHVHVVSHLGKFRSATAVESTMLGPRHYVLTRCGFADWRWMPKRPDLGNTP